MKDADLYTKLNNSFIVQYETKVDGKWLPVVRYDTKYGFVHRDLPDKKG
jgi:hypothetical protein